MLYNMVLVSAIHQHESAIGIHGSPPTPPLPPSPALWVVPEPLSELPAPYSPFPRVV